MPVDIKSGNAVANTVAQNFQSINKTLDVANSGSAQAANIAAISGAVLGNSDVVDSIGADGVQALTADFARVTNDMLGAGAASGGNAAAFQADMAKLTQDLNNAGIQFDTSNGQGHYDSGTLVPSSFSASSTSNSLTTSTSSVGTGGAAGAGNASTASTTNAASTVLSELNTVMSSVDTSSAALATSLPKMASDIRGIVALKQLPAAQQAKLQAFSAAVDKAVASYDPSNPQASLTLIDTTIQNAFSQSGLKQAAATSSGSSTGVTSGTTATSADAVLGQQLLAMKTITALNKAYMNIDDTSASSLQTSLKDYANTVSSYVDLAVNTYNLPADRQAALKTFASSVKQAAANFDPSNWKASEATSAQALAAAYKQSGLDEAAGIDPAKKDNGTDFLTEINNFALAALPSLQPILQQGTTPTVEAADAAFAQLQTYVASTTSPNLQVRGAIEKAMSNIKDAIDTYAQNPTTAGAQTMRAAISAAWQY